jgi:hypothetical protein
MGRRKDTIDPIAHFRQRISYAIFQFTGNLRCTDVNADPVLLYIEARLQLYLNRIRQKIESTKGKKKWSTADIFKALDGYTEYYGLRRFLIVKQYSRKAVDATIAEKGEDTEFEVNELPPPELNGEFVNTDQMQKELHELNDGSPLYYKYESERKEYLILADKLTSSMNAEQYREYHHLAQIKFINNKEAFDKWMNWPKMGKDLYLVFSWLALNRIRYIVQDAIYNRRSRIGLFQTSWLLYDRTHPIILQDFTLAPNTKKLDAIQEIEDNQLVELIVHTDQQFEEHGYSDRKFPILYFLERQNMMNKNKQSQGLFL